MKLLFFISVFFISFFFFIISAPSFSKIDSYTSRDMLQIYPDDRYERVLIDGIWWIIEYEIDGGIKNMYIDPNQ